MWFSWLFVVLGGYWVVFDDVWRCWCEFWLALVVFLSDVLGVLCCLAVVFCSWCFIAIWLYNTYIFTKKKKICTNVNVLLGIRGVYCKQLFQKIPQSKNKQRLPSFSINTRDQRSILQTPIFRIGVVTFRNFLSNEKIDIITW